MSSPIGLLPVVLIPFSLWFAAPAGAQDTTTTLQINVDDSDGNPLPCRIHLADSEGRPQRAAGQPFWNDHFVCSGRVALELAPGMYRYQIERGPEHARLSGTVDLQDSAKELNLTLTRIANLRASGWYSGDLHVHRPVEQVELLMRAEDLDVAPVITWWNARNLWNDRPLPDQISRRFDRHRLYHVMAGEDEREGGALLYFGLDKPLDITAVNREVPSPMQFVAAAKEIDPQVWIDIEKPFWWDVPVWLASGQMQSIGLANNHMCRSRMLENEAWGRPRDTERLPAPRGNGFWTQEIYYHLLNSGLRLPPSAGSASGVLPNPVGYNRVYVQVGSDTPLTEQTWFAGLSRGNSFVTNGPLLIARADGHLPGHQFLLEDHQNKKVTVQVELTSLDPISELEVIRNGVVVNTITCNDERHQEHQVELELSGAGWFLIRGIANIDHTFRFASTAPWYVATESDQSRISRRSAQFFLDWTRQRIARVKANVTEPDRLIQVIAPHRQAEQFWLQRVAAAKQP